MSLHRFFLESPLDDAESTGSPADLDSRDGEEVTLPLSAADVHHAVAVLRLRAGEDIEVVEPGATVARVQLLRVTAEGLWGTVAERSPRCDGPRVTLIQGVAKGEKMDAIVRQSVEVGVAEIVPVLTHRTVVKLDARKASDRGERWSRIAKSAAEQAHRDLVPRVHEPRPLQDAVSSLAPGTHVLVLWEEAHAGGLREAIVGLSLDRDDHPSLALVVGPEGGLSAEEVAALEGVGARTVSLGDTILRTETAAVVAVALAVHELGGLGNRR